MKVEAERQEYWDEIQREADVLSRIGLEVRVLRYQTGAEDYKFHTLNQKFREAINLLRHMKDLAYEGTLISQ